MACLAGIFSSASGQTVATPPGTIRFEGTFTGLENHQDYPAANPNQERPEFPPMMFFVTGLGRAKISELGYTQLPSFSVTYGGIVDYATAAGAQCARFTDTAGEGFVTSAVVQTSVNPDPALTTVTEHHTITSSSGQFTGLRGIFTVYRVVKGGASGSPRGTEGRFIGYLSYLTSAGARPQAMTP